MDFLEVAKPDYYRAQLWYCDPTTPVWRRRVELELKGAAFNWSHPTMNSDQASNWVDRFFREIHGTTWLPQYGFEQWSLYYLQRRGMSREQLKTFVHAFNHAVIEKLDASEKHETGEATMKRLREASQFASPERYRRQVPTPYAARSVGFQQASAP
jgi:hypothetical protein